MNQTILFNLPLNSTSFGNISFLIARMLFESEKTDNPIKCNIIPIGPVQLDTQDKLPPEFNTWLNLKIIKSLENYKKSDPCFRLWHLNGSAESIGSQQTLLSFYELDRPTKVELNIASNNNTVFTSKYTNQVFDNFGVTTKYLAPAFDDYNFYDTKRKYHGDGRIVFGVFGKAEKRKCHFKIIQSWIKKYGNNVKYALQCSIWNNFLNPQQNNALFGQMVNGNKPFNVEFYPWHDKNSKYNDFINSNNIAIGMSGGESIDLPVLHSVGLGKHAVILNAHAYKDWANNENAILVNPTGKEPAADGMFFRENDIYNVGSIFSWNEEEFIFGIEQAVKRFESNPINVNGLKIQQEHTKEKFLENIIKLTTE